MLLNLSILLHILFDCHHTNVTKRAGSKRSKTFVADFSNYTLRGGICVKINDVMSRDIVTCTPSDLITEIAQSMRALDTERYLVVEGPRVIGMITDRDIVTRSVAKDGQKFVKDVMSHEVISVGPESSSEEAAEIMAQHRIRRLPVIKNGGLIGFVALADISVPSETLHEASQALHEISEPRHL